MKYLQTIILILCGFHLFSQYGDDGYTINPNMITITQSSTFEDNLAYYAIDDSPETISQTKEEEVAWLLFEFEERQQITELSFKSNELSEFYIVFSEAPFTSLLIDELLEDSWVDYIYVEDEVNGNTTLPVPNLNAKYMAILPTQCHTTLQFNNMVIATNGFGAGGGMMEICNNGIDDDLDGRIDCEDTECGVGRWITTENCPSCFACEDGRICVLGRVGNEVSINGGASVPLTVFSIPPFFVLAFHCFDELPQGSYDITMINPLTCCEETKTVVLDCHDPNPPTECDNWDFENGDFGGWTGWTGTFNGMVNNVMPGLSIPLIQDIVQTQGFSDPNVPLQFNSAVLGNSCARIGHLTTGARVGAINKCFTVTSADSNLEFLAAWVANNPDHPAPDNPFFQYTITANNGGNALLFDSGLISSDSPILTNGNGNWRYLPWQCYQIDLSAFIGTSVCIEIISSGCGWGAHPAYAYVDFVCDEEDLSPIDPVFVETDECGGEIITVTGSGDFFVSSSWTISRVDVDGSNPTNTITTDEVIGQIPSLVDIIALYEGATGTTLNCNKDYLSVTLNLFNDCASSNSDEIIIDVPCPNSIGHPEDVHIEYEAIDEVCEIYEDVITGYGSDYESSEWKISMVDLNGQNPTGVYITNPSTVTNPTISGVVDFYQNATGNTINCLTRKLKVELILTNICGSTTSEPIFIDVDCYSWASNYPNVFHKNGTPPNDKFNLFFQSTDPANNCSINNAEISGITYYRLQIFDRWGNKVFDEEETDSDGNIKGKNIKWDGTFNGNFVLQGVYTWEAYVSSCPVNKKCSSSWNYDAKGNLQGVEDKSGNPIQAEVFADAVTFLH